MLLVVVMTTPLLLPQLMQLGSINLLILTLEKNIRLPLLKFQVITSVLKIPITIVLTAPTLMLIPTQEKPKLLP